MWDRGHKYYTSEMCRVLGVSRSGYYKWSRRQRSRSAYNRRLAGRIRLLFDRYNGRHGRPYLWALLRREGWDVNHKRVQRLMRAEGLVARSRRKGKATTDSGHSRSVAANLLARNFSAPAANRVWVGDITYIRTMEGWLYLATVLDLFSRKIVGWHLADRLTASLAQDALGHALRYRRTGGTLLFHSDRGLQYAAAPFRRVLARHGITQSMARKGDCWDNAPAESWFATLKRECVPQGAYSSKQRARLDIFRYIEGYYNRNRLHSSLNYRPPDEYESLYA